MQLGNIGIPLKQDKILQWTLRENLRINIKEADCIKACRHRTPHTNWMTTMPDRQSCLNSQLVSCSGRSYFIPPQSKALVITSPFYLSKKGKILINCLFFNLPCKNAMLWLCIKASSSLNGEHLMMHTHTAPASLISLHWKYQTFLNPGNWKKSDLIVHDVAFCF